MGGRSRARDGHEERAEKREEREEGGGRGETERERQREARWVGCVLLVLAQSRSGRSGGIVGVGGMIRHRVVVRQVQESDYHLTM